MTWRTYLDNQYSYHKEKRTGKNWATINGALDMDAITIYTHNRGFLGKQYMSDTNENMDEIDALQAKQIAFQVSAIYLIVILIF